METTENSAVLPRMSFLTGTPTKRRDIDVASQTLLAAINSLVELPCEPCVTFSGTGRTYDNIAIKLHF